MKRTGYFSRRRWRYDLFPLSLAVLMPVLLLLAIPFDSFSPPPSPRERQPSPAFCAFVSLTEREEQRALAAARTAWQTGSSLLRRQRPELFAETLPVSAPRPVLRFEDRPVSAAAVDGPFVAGALPTDFRAPPPRHLPPAAAPAPPPAFSREELLSLEPLKERKTL